MVTVKQIERLWRDNSFDRIVSNLAASRPEGAPPRDGAARRPVVAAAVALARLEEISFAHAPIYRTLLHELLIAQESDGGWGDPITTALCLRALLLSRNSSGAAIDRGLTYLASLQQPQGLWPRIPLRRMPADPLGSAWILFQLAGFPRFRDAVRFNDAVDWFESREGLLDPAAARLWDHAAPRCRSPRRTLVGVN